MTLTVPSNEPTTTVHLAHCGAPLRAAFFAFTDEPNVITPPAARRPSTEPTDDIRAAVGAGS